MKNKPLKKPKIRLLKLEWKLYSENEIKNIKLENV
jgi:hypothetical protein